MRVRTPRCQLVDALTLAGRGSESIGPPPDKDAGRTVAVRSGDTPLHRITAESRHEVRPTYVRIDPSRAASARHILIIVDFKREPANSPAWILQHVRAGKETVVKEIEAAGFRLSEERDFMQENYFLRFTKQ